MAPEESSVPADAAGAESLAALAARVAELERQVAALTSASLPEVPARSQPRADSSLPMLPSRPPAPPPPATQPIPHPLPSARSLEDRLGAQVFNLIGLLAILISSSLFLKLAIERGWLGPLARVLIGLAAGAGFIVWSERFRSKGFAAFSYSLKALGSAILYLSLWAGFQLYHLMPAAVALVAMLLVTAWNGFMAWSQDAELLAAYGLVGGFLTPLLLSTGGDHETFLFTYLAALDLATVLLMRWKPWQRLLLPAFAATAGYFIGWYAQFFHALPLTGSAQPLHSTWDAQSAETCAFAVLFSVLFMMVSAKGYRLIASVSGEIIVPVLLPLAHAAFLSLALYSVLQDSGLHPLLAWVMVALAAFYLGLVRLQATTVAAAVHLACAVVFLTIAIPLKASGHTLTTAWLVEGLVLYWASTRVQAESGAPARVLTVLSLCGYGLGLVSLAGHWFTHAAYASFFNADLGAAMIGVTALAGAAWLAHSRRDEPTLLATFAAIDAVAVLLTLREVIVSQFSSDPHAAFANVDFATALLGLAVLAFASWSAYRISSEPEIRSLASLGGATLVLFNLLTLVTIVREIGALWHRSDANLQRSLAISGFLMVYAAALLTAGFWQAQRVRTLAGPGAALVHHRQGVPLRHQWPEPGLPGGELPRAWRAPAGRQLRLPEGLAGTEDCARSKRGQSMKGLAALLLLSLATADDPRHAPSPLAAFEYRRDVRLEAVTAEHASYACALLDAEVFAHTEPGLADLRLSAAASGVPFTPYAITLSTTAPEGDAARILNLGARAKRVVAFDLAMPDRRYSAVQLGLHAHDFIASAKVTGLRSLADREPTQLGAFTLFDLSSQHLGHSSTLEFAESSFPFLHVELSLSPAPGAPGAGLFPPAMVASAEVPPSRLAQTLYTPVAETSSLEQRPRRSVAVFNLPARVPVERVTVVLEPGDRTNFNRTVTVAAKTAAAETEQLSAEISRVRLRQAGQEIRSESLSFPAILGSNAQAAARVEVSVENGDDQPLKISAIRLEMRERKVCFPVDPDSAAAGPTLLYGATGLPAPVYDFGHIFNPSDPARAATLGPETLNPFYSAPRPPQKTFPERHPELLWIALLSIVAILGSAALRSARRM